MITHLDHNFGRLETFLAESGLRDNTIVVFLTDNGGTAGVPVFNAGLRAGKTTYYEGGHRVPCWVWWPAGRPGELRDIDTPTQMQDLLPTLLELCGLPPADGLVGLAGVYADNTGHIRSAVGYPTGSRWGVNVRTADEYEIVLRRWPASADVPLGAAYDAAPGAVGGKNYNPPSKTFPTVAAVGECGGRSATAPTDRAVTLRLTLPAGRTTLMGWLRDAAGADLCGAFFATARRLP